MSELDTRWNELQQNAELAALTKKKPDNQNTHKACVLDFNGVLVEKDVSPKINAMFREKILLLFDPLSSQTDEQIQKKFEQKKLFVKNESEKRMIDALAELVADECHAPAKGTPARKTVYDLAESLIESGEIKIHVYSDAIPFLDRIKSTHHRLMLSRGSLSLLTKSCKGSGLLEHLDQIESTIPYGNAKTAETFIRFAFEQRKKTAW